MSPIRIFAVVLAGLGIVVLAYSGISFRSRGKPVDLGIAEIQTTRSHFIPPVAGAVALVAGIGLWLAGGRTA